jgi:hypothetical protein
LVVVLQNAVAPLHCASDTHCTHAFGIVAIGPVQTFMSGQVPGVPASRLVTWQRFSRHASVVHALPSAQSLAARHPTHTAAPPMLPQTGDIALQPKSVPAIAVSAHALQVAAAPLPRQSGAAMLQPLSMLASAAVSTQPTHAPAALHTPAAQVVPTATGVDVHAPAVQASVVQTLLSLQSLAARHATQLFPADPATQ